MADSLDEELLDKLADAEESGQIYFYDDKVGKGYVKQPHKAGFIRKQLGKQNRIFLIGGSASTLVVVGLIALFLTLAPLKILHIVNNLQGLFYKTGENAVQRETNALFSDYLRKSFRNCPGAVTKECNSFSDGSKVSQLYRGWRAARLEDSISSKDGIEFKRSANGHFYLKAAGMTGNGADMKEFLDSSETLDDFIQNSGDPQFRKVSRSQLRQAYSDAVANQTKWKKVMYRYKVGGLLSKKYGLRRCVIACSTTDNFADWKDNKKNAFKLVLAERVLRPRSEMLADVIQCVIAGGCDPSSRDATDSDGRKMNATQKAIQDRLTTIALDETGKYADAAAHAKGILDDGYQKYLAKVVIAKLLGTSVTDTTTKELSNAVPVIGWINGAANTIDSLNKAPKMIRAMSYMTNAAAMANLYGTYRVYADETKSGHVDSEMIGSFTDALGRGDANATGGNASAEETPLYSTLMDGTPTPKNSTMSGVFSGTAYAAESKASVNCTDGPLPIGKLLCPEEILGGTNSAVNDLQAVMGKLKPLATLAHYWRETIGKPMQIIAKAASSLLDPVLNNFFALTHLRDLITAAMDPLINGFSKWLVPTPFSDNMSGGRIFDLLAGGADVSGNEFANYTLGGQKLSDQQLAAILDEQNQQNLRDYQSQPLLARLTDTNSPYSPASKLIMSAPNSLGGVGQSVANMFIHPLSRINSVFSQLFSPRFAFAAAPQADPFGITQYGYPVNDPNFKAANIDPQNYWKTQCTSDGSTIDWTKPVNAAWQDTVTNNELTGMPENTTTNPCLLIQAAVGSAGAVYDSSLLTAEDQGELTSDNSTDTTVGSGGPGLPSGTAQAIATQLKPLIASGKVNCVPTNNNDIGCSDIINTANGKSIRGGAGCNVDALDATLLGMLLKLTQMGHTFTLSALCSDHSDTGLGGHSGGKAADFWIIDGVNMGPADVPWTPQKIQAGSKLDADIASFMPKSTGFGQIQCHPTFDFLAGFVTFEDACHHQHIQVP